MQRMFIDQQMYPVPELSSGGFRDMYCITINWDWCGDIGNLEAVDEYHVRRAMEERASDFQYWNRRAREQKRDAFKALMANNFADNRSWRFSNLARYNVAPIKALFKQFGEQWNGGFHNVDDLLETLNEIHSCNARYSKKLFDDLDLSDEFFRCKYCGEYFCNDESTSSHNGDLYCEDCASEQMRWSSCMSEYIRNDDAYPVYASARGYRNDEPDDYVTWSWGRDNLYNWDDVFFNDEDAYREISDEDSNDDYYPEDDDGLQSWHNTYRDFTERCTGGYPALGVELEVYCDDRKWVVNELRDDFPGDDFILEKDGSLDCECGMEIITQPFGRNEWNEFAPKLIGKLNDFNVVGYNEPAGTNYGIHVTVHRRHFSPLAEARISMFLSAKENENFVRAVAQRSQIYHPQHGVGIGHTEAKSMKLSVVSSENVRRYHRDESRHGYQRKIVGKGKYCPVNWKENLAEFRIFQSTTNLASFMKNLEFVWALHAWTKNETATGSTFRYEDFLLWLNTPERRKEFPFLITFLSKRVFYGTNFAPIVSNWQHLMVKPDQSEAIEPMAA